MGDSLRGAIDLAVELVGLAIFPLMLGSLFAVAGHALYEAVMASGSSRFRQYAHFWVAGMIVWAIASGRLAGAVGEYGW